MGNRSHKLLALKEIESRENKEKYMGVMGIDLGSPKSENTITKFNIRLSVAQGIQNRVPLTNSVLTHKLHVNK